MKKAALYGLLLLPMVAYGNDTAYQALRLIGSERDKEHLNHVIELKGRSGAPQPEQWVVLIDDPMARGGLRELEVAGGRITSERTPVSTYGGTGPQPVMNFSRLNLDSQGAFTVAEGEALKARVGFDSIDYFLRQDEKSGAPVWVLQLLDGQKHAVGSLTIAADTGNVIQRSFEPVDATGDVALVEDGPVYHGHEVDGDEEEGESIKSKIKGTAKDVGHTLNKGFHKVGGSLEKFFTGKRTVDRKYRDEGE